MTQPVLFLVDDDPRVVAALKDDLTRRFGRDFEVLGTSSVSDGLATLHDLAVQQRPVALLIVSHKMGEMPGPVPGIFAVGDARYRSIKRVASAVGDGATAIRLVQEFLASTSAAA